MVRGLSRTYARDVIIDEYKIPIVALGLLASWLSLAWPFIGQVCTQAKVSCIQDDKVSCVKMLSVKNKISISHRVTVCAAKRPVPLTVAGVKDATVDGEIFLASPIVDQKPLGHRRVKRSSFGCLRK